MWFPLFILIRNKCTEYTALNRICNSLVDEKIYTRTNESTIFSYKQGIISVWELERKRSLPVWMAVVLNWHHIRIHSVQRLSSRISDGQHIVVYYSRPFHRTINVNELDAIRVQSIRLHRLNIPMEIGDQLMVPMQALFSMAPDIMRALNLFAIVEIIPKLKHTKNEISIELVI